MDVRMLLEKKEWLIVLESPKGDYRFEYYTTKLPNPGKASEVLQRSYRLVETGKGGSTPEPWDHYDLATQTMLVRNLITMCGYEITKVVTGWVAKCSYCGREVKGNIWEPRPRKCSGPDSHGKKHAGKDVIINEQTLPTEGHGLAVTT